MIFSWLHSSMYSMTDDLFIWNGNVNEIDNEYRLQQTYQAQVEDLAVWKQVNSQITDKKVAVLRLFLAI